MSHPLRRIHIILYFRILFRQLSQISHNLHTIRQHQSRDWRGDLKSGCDDKDWNDENEDVADEVKADTEPALIDYGDEVGAVHDVEVVVGDMGEFVLFSECADGH